MISQTPAPVKPDTDASDFGLIDLLIVLAKNKITLLLVPFLAGVVAALVTLSMPDIYTARTKILPPQQSQSSATSMLKELTAITGGLAGGLGSAFLARNANDMYVGILRSRTIADKLVERFDLKSVYRQHTLTGARTALEGNTEIKSGSDAMISIEVDSKDPKLAAELANAYVEELYKLTQTFAVTEASQRRLFFEKQLKAGKEELALAEAALKHTQERTGMIKLDDQGRVILEAFARLRAQIAAKEVQLGAVRTFATKENPDFIRGQQELVELRAQLAKMEQSTAGTLGDILVPTGRVPEAGLEYVRRLRDVKYHEAISELLAKQYEIARIDEAKESSLIQVLDRAVAPERKSKPRRTIIVLLTAAIAGLLAIFGIFVREAGEVARRDPQHAQRLAMLRRHLWRS